MCVYDCHKEALPWSVSYYLQIVDYSGFTTTIKQFVLHSKEDPQPAAAPWRFDFHSTLERRNLLRLYWSWILTGGKRCKVFPQRATKGYTASLSKNKRSFILFMVAVWETSLIHWCFSERIQTGTFLTAPLINACDAYNVFHWHYYSCINKICVCWHWGHS